jgi:ribonuclease R
VPLVTIDGEDARDFDDAVYCEPAKVGRGKGWRLLVAIADVSHYVETGSAIDIDAYDRATSVYFPRRVIPMLPEKLSNGLCSLNPEVDRLCMVCDMLITANGEIQAYQFYPAVMWSHARFTYTEVAAILANTRGPEAARRKDLSPT